MSQIPFRCPECGSEKLVVSTAKPKIEDFYAAKCADCGSAMSENVIKTQARKMAADAIKKMLKR
jgi:transcription elongation factor Elf1